MKELNVERNLRKRRVGISGTNFKPLDNEFQILEALKITCEIINSKESIIGFSINILHSAIYESSLKR